MEGIFFVKVPSEVIWRTFNFWYRENVGHSVAHVITVADRINIYAEDQKTLLAYSDWGPSMDGKTTEFRYYIEESLYDKWTVEV